MGNTSNLCISSFIPLSDTCCLAQKMVRPSRTTESEVDLAYLKGTNSDNVAYPMAMDEGSCVPRES